jgi:putative addiction module antidote
MSQKIIKVGSSIAVTVPKHISSRLELEKGSEVEVTEDGGKMVVTKNDITVTEHDKEITELTKNFIRKYRKDIDALA